MDVLLSVGFEASIAWKCFVNDNIKVAGSLPETGFHLGSDVTLSIVQIEALPEPPVTASPPPPPHLLSPSPSLAVRTAVGANIVKESLPNSLAVIASDAESKLTTNLDPRVQSTVGYNPSCDVEVEPLPSYMSYEALADVILFMHEPDPEVSGTAAWIAWYDGLADSLEVIHKFSTGI